MATTPAAGAAPAKSKKLIVIGAVVALLVVVAAAAALFIINKNRQAAEEHEVQATAAVLVPVFLPLENMVVNLADRGGDRFAQIGITLELQNDRAAEQVKQFMPSIRNGILMLVSQRTADELLLREGKEKLAADIRAEVARPLGSRGARADDEYDDTRPPNPVRRVLFSSFIIQ